MAQDKPAATCWCFEVTVDPAALARLPAEARGTTCICARCASAQPVPADALTRPR
jgi:hypothetical protein